MNRLFSIAARSGRATPSGLTNPPLSRDDHTFLDQAFESILEAVQEGHEIDLDTLTRDRPTLRASVEHLVNVACQITPAGRNRRLPASPPGYTIITELGHGGMATVYLAKQCNVAERTVALKMLPDHLTSASTRERFRREASAVASLQHRHIVPVYDMIRHDGTFSFAMEFIDGGSLHNVIESVRMQADQPALLAAAQTIGMPETAMRCSEYSRLVANWGVHIADALHAVHAAGMLHRDVKPSNILLRRDGTALLSDFGLVRDSSETSLTASGAFAGTAAYSSPEQLRALGSLDIRSDVYSLGASLFHALTLRKPFAGDSAVQVLHAIETSGRSRIRRSSGVPFDLGLIVLKAMDPDPSRRYATAAEVAADLSRFLEHRPVIARPASPFYVAKKFVSRYRTQVAAAVITGIAVSGIAAAAFVRTSLWPQWSRQSLMEARALCASPNIYNILFTHELWEQRDDPGAFVDSSLSSKALLAQLKRGLHLYDEAIRLGDDSPQSHAERDAVALLLHSAYGDSDQIPPQEVSSLVRGCVLELLNHTSRKSSLPNRQASRSVMSSIRAQLANAPSRDVRQIALATCVLGDAGSALEAWRELEARGDTDPFTDGMLGLMLLINDAPSLAYPRLYHAAIAFPELPNFSMYAADAALRCGDLAKSRQLLAQAGSHPSVDSDGIIRLEIMTRFESGDVAGAIDQARALFATPYSHASPILALQLSRRLADVGQPERISLEFAALACWYSVPVVPRAARDLRPLASRFWTKANHNERRDVIAAALLSDFSNPHTPRWPDGFMRGVFASMELPEFSTTTDVFQSDEFQSLYERYPSTENTASTVRIFDAIHSAAPERLKAIAEWILTGHGEQPEELR